MKNLLINTLLLFVSITTAVASNNRADELMQKMWNTNDVAFNITQSPEKWSKEPAIILAQSYRYEYNKPILSTMLTYNYHIHRRVKLNDKSGVNDFSEIQYPYHQGVYAGFKVIKPDGSEHIIDLATAVNVNTGSKTTKKIAIPNLKEGDILDYYVCNEQEIAMPYIIYYFDPVIYTMAESYPIVEQRIEFRFKRKCYISLRSLNGAPELAYRDDEERDERIYLLVDKDREALKDLIWFYPYRELPTIKFRAAFAKSAMNTAMANRFLDEPGVIKKSVTNKQVLNLAYDYFNNYSSSSYTNPKAIIKYVKKNLPKTASNFEKAKAGFYFLRNQNLRFNEIFTIADNETSGYNPLTAYFANQIDNERQTLVRYYRFLTDLKIPFDIVVGSKRNISSIEDLLLEEEIELLFRVKQGEEHLYLSSFYTYNEINEIRYSLLGTSAFYYNGLTEYSALSLKKTQLPITSSNDNLQKNSIEVQLTDDFSNTKAEITNSTKGALKYLHNTMTDYYDYEKEESQRFKMTLLDDINTTSSYRNKLKALKISYLNTREAKRINILKGIADENYDFKVDTLNNIQILQTGRFDTLPEFIIKYNIETTDLVKKVGKNYMINICKLIEKQVKIGEEGAKRDFSIYQSSLKKIQNTIRLKIPQGYTAEGLENLTNNIDNEQGAFKSSARIDKDYLIIETEKEYKELISTKDKWDNYLAFINAAYNFTEQKVLLRKL